MRRNQDQLYQFYQNCKWLFWIFPNFFNEIHSPDPLFRKGLNLEKMKEQQEWFFTYCCEGGYVREKYQEFMTPDQIQTINIVNNVLAERKRKSSHDYGYGHQQYYNQSQNYSYGYQYGNNSNYYSNQYPGYQNQYPGYQNQYYPQYYAQNQNNYQSQGQGQNYQPQGYAQNYQTQAQGYGQNYQGQGYGQNYQGQGYGQNYQGQGYGQNYQGDGQSYQYDDKNNQEQNQDQNRVHNQQSHSQNTSYTQKVEQPPKESQTKAKDNQTKNEASSQVVEPDRIIDQPEPQRCKFSIQQIKLMIDAVKEEQLRKNSDSILLEQIDQMMTWQRTQQTFEVVDKNKKNPGQFQKGKNYNPDRNTEFNRGSKYNRNPPPGVSGVIDITVGKNQSFATIMQKKKLKERAAETNYAKIKMEEEASLNEIEKAKRDINFDLNRIAPENLKDIFKELCRFAKQKKQVCETLIHLIIEKAWEQPKYASSYAKLCNYFCKLSSDDFEYDNPAGKQIKQVKNNKDKEKKAGNNHFKHLLIEEVQHSFDEQEKKFPNFQNEYEKDDFLSKLKKKMIGNVKFISELIKSKVVSKKTIKYVLQNLISTFFNDYNTFNRQKTPQSSIYYFHFEVIIEFMENLGQKFEEIAEPKEDNKPSRYLQVEGSIRKIMSGEMAPKDFDFTLINQLKANQFFRLFKVIDVEILSKQHTRISALLKNLEERRQNGWKKHHVEAQGPKKLKQLAKQEDETMQPQQKAKNDLAVLDNKLSKVLKNYVENDKDWKKDLNELFKAGYKKSQIYTSYLKQLGEDKKDFVIKKLEIFIKYLLEEGFSSKEFREAWKISIVELAFLASDIPFCGAALAKILKILDEKNGIRVEEYFIKFDKQEQDEQLHFMADVFRKFYYYSELEQIKKYVETTQKLSHLL